METSDSPPMLVESSDEESSQEPERIKGVFPWGFKKTRNHSLQVNMWLQLDEQYRSNALHSSMVKLMAPFLCLASSDLPAKWKEWYETLNIIGLPKTAIDDPAQYEQGLFCCRMLMEAHAGIAKLSTKRNDLIAIFDFLCSVDQYQPSDLTRVITVARGQQQIKFLCDSMSDISKQHSGTEVLDSTTSEDDQSSFESRVFAALLAGKQFAATVHKITFDGCDVVQELSVQLAETGKMLKFKDLGNEHFKNNNLEKALSIYTEAINDFSFSSVLYCNRCITLMKLEKFKLAVADGYRATCLTPKWAKAYHRRADALRMEGKLDWAIETAELGSKICDKKDKVALDKLLGTLLDLEAEQPQKGTMPARKYKSKTRRKPVFVQEDPPPLLSDADSIGSLSDSEYLRSKRNKKKAEKKKDTKTQSKSRDRLNQDVEGKKVEVERSEIAKEKPKKVHKPYPREDERTKKYEEERQRSNSRPMPVENKLFIGDIYQNHVSLASKSLLEKKFDTAICEYDAALKIVTESKQKEWKVTAVENFILIYARGISSLEMRTPPQVARSLNFFAKIMKQTSKEYCHPMAFYSSARAQYYLNNFSDVAPTIESGMQLIRKKNFPGVLTWPGMNEVIPESNVNTLKVLMGDLAKWSFNPPKPDAFCRYENCTKDYSRSEIYVGDIEFEGFIKVFCDWDCVTSFHFKCWSKYKHLQYDRSGDRELLGLQCFTEGCQGLICEIQMLDESYDTKKDVHIPKRSKEKNTRELKGTTSKSGRNLERRMRLMKEAKERKRSYRVAHTIYETDDLMAKKKPDSSKLNGVFSNTDVSNVTIIKREEEDKNDSAKTSKGKSKNKQKKKATNVVSLQTFLGDEKYLNSDEARRIIERTQQSETPFQVPQEYRTNVFDFESTVTEEEQLKLSSVYSFFEEFYKRNGPRGIHDEIFTREINKEMLLLVEAHYPTFIEFLLSKKGTFLRVGDNIGLESHREMMEQLNKKVVGNKPPLQQTVQKAESASNPKQNGPSAFSKDLWDVGDVPLSEVQNMLGSKGDKNSRQASSHPFYMRDMKNFPVLKTGQNKQTATAVKSEKIVSTKVKDKKDEEKATTPAVNKKTDKKGTEPKSSQKFQIVMEENLPKEKSVPKNNNKPKTQEPTLTLKTGDVENSPQVSPPLPVATCASIAVQTELMPSYKSEIAKLQEDKKRLEEIVEEHYDRFTRLNVTSRTEKAALSKELEEVNGLLKKAELEAASATQNAETEVKKVARERATLLESTKTLKKQLKDARDAATVLKETLATKEREVDNLGHVMQDMRDNLLKQQYEANEKIMILDNQLKESHERAVLAELTTLETQENFATKTLMLAKKESDKFATEFEQMSFQYNNNAIAKGKVMEASLLWKKNAEECRMKLETARNLFSNQSIEIRRGKVLSELPNIIVPTPPPPGPNFQQLSAVIRSAQIGMANFNAAQPNGSSNYYYNNNQQQNYPQFNNNGDHARNFQAPTPHQLVRNQQPSPPQNQPLLQERDQHQTVVQSTTQHQTGQSPDQPSLPKSAVNQPTQRQQSLNQTKKAAFAQPSPHKPAQQQPSVEKPTQHQSSVKKTTHPKLTLKATNPAQRQLSSQMSSNKQTWPNHTTNGREGSLSSPNSLSPGPVTTANSTHSFPTQHQPQPQPPQHKGSFERIMDQLMKIYPNMSRPEIAQCIKEVRQNNNSSLTGLSLEDIVKQASAVIHRRHMGKKQVPPSNVTVAPSRPVASSTVAPWQQSTQHTKPLQQQFLDVNEDEPCVICHDPLYENDIHKLLCGHVFHSECLNKWLTRNRTCPTCRDYAIDTSEYPTLKSTFRR